MNVLSLFDGMSCCQLALIEAGIPINKYYASEVDKAAIEQTKHSFPDTICLGDVAKIDGTKFKGKIDFLAGGSPCQDFSFAGLAKGMLTECNELITTLDRYLELKQSGFKFVGQSYLFWEFVRLLKEIEPKYFFLENTKMEARWAGVITEALGVMPVEVDSAVLSAQRRKRNYWSNIKTEQNGFFDQKTYFPNLTPSKLVLRDILEPVEDIDESLIITNLPDGFVGLNLDEKGVPLRTTGHGSKDYHNFDVIDLRKVFTGLDIDKKGRTLRASGTLVKNYKHTYDIINDSRIGNTFEHCKCARRLSVLECQRLQTVPDNYNWVVAKTNRYKMLGNGWTVKVIAEFFKPLRKEFASSNNG